MGTQYQSMIDDALAKARGRMGGASKTASAKLAGSSLLKEAEEVGNALEYVALMSVNDGSAAGHARAEMVRDYLKQADAESAGVGVSSGATATTGTQAQVPPGKKVLPGATPSANSPAESESPNGVQPQSASKKAGATLYDVLMGNKTAASGGPAESETGTPAAGIPSGGDNANRGILSSMDSIVGASKRDAKAPTRAAAAQVWGHTDATTSQGAAQAVAPIAAAKGEIKVANLIRAFRKEAEKEEAGEKENEGKEKSLLKKLEKNEEKEKKASNADPDDHNKQRELAARRAVIQGLVGRGFEGAVHNAPKGHEGDAGAGYIKGRLAGHVAGTTLGGGAGAAAGGGAGGLIGALGGAAAGGAATHRLSGAALGALLGGTAGAVGGAGAGALPGMAAGGIAGRALGGYLGVKRNIPYQKEASEPMLGKRRGGPPLRSSEGLAGRVLKAVGRHVSTHKKKYIAGGLAAGAAGTAGVGAAGLAGAAGLTAAGLGARHLYKKHKAKHASALADYSDVFSLAANGDLGPEAQQYALAIEQF